MPAHHHPSGLTVDHPSFPRTAVPSQPLAFPSQPIRPLAGTQPPRSVQGAMRASELSPSSPNMMVPSPAPAAHLNVAISVSLPSLAGAQRTSDGPPMGLVIPYIPVKLPDGGRAPKSDSWRDIVRHWTVGEPRLRLFVALKDWPHHYYNGRHGRKFNSLYHQRGVIAKEFLHV